ncbi:MAG TPA: hypothetical protein PLV91_06985 [Verrucomicrobiota bacterium]|jgi:hypothetical protein|nr:hypothetical protein [Verrucomicrobiota bacterium]
MRFKLFLVLALCAACLCEAPQIFAQEVKPSDSVKPDSVRTNTVTTPEKKEGVKEKAKEFLSLEEYGEWMMNLFRTKDIERFKYALEYAGKQRHFTQPDFASMSFVFFGTTMRTYPETLDVFFKTVGSLPASEQPIALMAVRYANVEKGNKLLEDLLKKEEFEKAAKKYEEYAKYKMPDLYKMGFSAEMLDLLWSEFFVTGDAKPIKRITEALPGLEDEDNLGMVIVASAARWSLTSNAVQFDRVLEILKGFQKENPSKAIADIIEKAEEGRQERKTDSDDSPAPTNP